MRRAVIYARVSTDKQAEEGTSLDTQESVCLRKAIDIGAQVVAVLRDEGVSGALYTGRPGMQEALRMIEAGEADCLICANLSRYSRDTEHQQAIQKRLKKAGGRLFLCDLEVTDTPAGKLQFGVMGNFAEYERAVIAERLHGGRTKRAESGVQPYRSSPPFGYHIPKTEEVVKGLWPAEELGKYQLVPDEAEILREIFLRSASGASLRSLTRWLTESGVKTKSGGDKWYAATVRGMLTNPCYKGTAMVGRSEAILDEDRLARGLKTKYHIRNRELDECILIPVPAIVSADLWEAVQRRLQANQTKMAGNPGRRYLLSGLLICPDCGDKMRATRRDTTVYYVCKKLRECSFTRCERADVIEPAVIGAVREIVQHPEMLQAAIEAYVAQPRPKPARSPQDLEKDLAALKKREDATVLAQIAGVEAGADPAAYAAVFDKIREDRRRLQAQLAAIAANDQAEVLHPKQTAHILAQAAADVETVFASEDLTAADRNVALSAIVATVHIVADGYRIDLISLPQSDLIVSRALCHVSIKKSSVGKFSFIAEVGLLAR